MWIGGWSAPVASQSSVGGGRSVSSDPQQDQRGQ